MSRIFCRMMGVVLLGITSLGWTDSTKDRTPSYGREDDSQYLQQAKDDFALVIFTVNNCPACASQKQHLMLFKELYGWKIKEFNAQEHMELVKAFNIYRAPSILLIRRFPSQWVLLSEGRSSLYEIEKIVSGGIRLMRGRRP